MQNGRTAGDLKVLTVKRRSRQWLLAQIGNSKINI